MQEKIDERRILVRSYLKVASQEYAPRNSFDAFFPFIVAAADPREGLTYDPYKIAITLRSFGWQVGGDFVDLFTNGMADRGLLTSEDVNRARHWTAAAAKPDDSAAEADIEHLKQSFFDFTEGLSGLLLHNFGPDDRLHELAKALATNRLFSIDALKEYAEREVDDRAAANGEKSAVSEHDFDFLCARYIQHCHRSDTRAFDALLGLANIGIVTHLANFFHHRTDNLEKTGSPTLILDGPFLIDYIGLNGETRRTDAAIIIDSARSRGSKIWAFRHSISEAKDIVTAVALSDPSERYGPLALAMRNGSVTLEALHEFRNDPFGVVDRLDIVDQIFDINGRHKWQEEDFNSEEDWQAVYANLSGWKDLPRRRDCDSILGIMRLRAQHLTRSPWDTRFFLLTSNPGLARLAKKACIDQDLIGAADVGPAISRNEFAAILWLAGDPNNRSEVVTAHLLAAAQGMLARDKGMINKVHEYTANLETNRKELVDAIIQTELSYEMLQDLTLGNPARITEDSFERVIDSLIEKGRIAGAKEATAEEKKATRRLRDKAEKARLAMEASAEVALKAAEQATLAERASLEANIRAKAAEFERQQSEDAKANLEIEARRQLVSARAARNAVAGILSGQESDWCRIAANVNILTSWMSLIALVILASIIGYLGSLINPTTGFAIGILFLLISSLITVANDLFKTKRESWIKENSARWTRNLLAPQVRRFEKRLGLPQGLVVFQVVDRRVTVTNREDLFEFLESKEF